MAQAPEKKIFENQGLPRHRPQVPGTTEKPRVRSSNLRLGTEISGRLANTVTPAFSFSATIAL